MNWDDLRIFLAIARMGSISGAARHLDVRHTTVSRRLQKLEQSIGVRLMDKKRTGYELTPAGEDLREAALRMEREVLRVDGALDGQDQQLTGNLRVTTVGNIANSFLLPVLRRFTDHYPGITLQLSVSNADVSLPEREADIAIRVTNEPADTLVGKKVGRISSAVYGSRDYLAEVRARNASPRWLGVKCCNFHKHWTHVLSGGESFGFTVDEPIITHEALRKGLGIAILPCHMGDPDPELERCMDPPAEMDLDLWVLYHRDLRRIERVRVFRDFVATELESLRPMLEGRLAEGR